MPLGQVLSLSRLIRAAGLRWPAEESFEFSKDCFGLDQSQVRLYTAIARHTVLVMAALAICAVTAALLRRRTDTRAPAPARPDQPPPAHPGMIPLTIPETGRLLAQPPPPPSRRTLAGVAPPSPGLLSLVPQAHPAHPGSQDLTDQTMNGCCRIRHSPVKNVAHSSWADPCPGVSCRQPSQQKFCGLPAAARGALAAFGVALPALGRVAVVDLHAGHVHQAQDNGADGGVCPRAGMGCMSPAPRSRAPVMRLTVGRVPLAGPGPRRGPARSGQGLVLARWGQVAGGSWARAPLQLTTPHCSLRLRPPHPDHPRPGADQALGCPRRPHQ